MEEDKNGYKHKLQYRLTMRNVLNKRGKQMTINLIWIIRWENLQTKSHSLKRIKILEIQTWIPGVIEAVTESWRCMTNTNTLAQDKGRRRLYNTWGTGENNQGSGEMSDLWYLRKDKSPETRGEILFKIKLEVYKTKKFSFIVSFVGVFLYYYLCAIAIIHSVKPRGMLYSLSLTLSCGRGWAGHS